MESYLPVRYNGNVPELPEIENIVRTLRPRIVGARVLSLNIHSSHLLRDRSEPLISVKGAVVTGVRRRGKLLLLDFDNGKSLVFHLKMTGQIFLPEGISTPDKHVHLSFLLSSVGMVCFRDQRKFGYCICRPTTSLSDDPALSLLGPEPLELSENAFLKLLKGRRGLIKNLLLNQSFLAGIGNIYADEILFRSGIHPQFQAEFLSGAQVSSLFIAIRDVLSAAVSLGGSTIRDFRHSDGRPGSFQNSHKVYGNEGRLCICGRAAVRRITVGGRSTYFCPRCQRPQRKTVSNQGREGA